MMLAIYLAKEVAAILRAILTASEACEEGGVLLRFTRTCGFLPTGPLWYCTICNTRRMPTELPTHLGWTWTWPDDIETQWQEANANRRMQFKVGNYKDSNIRMLTGAIKADWIQLPVERYLTALPTLRQGVIAGVFKIKGAAPWAITRAEKLQLSVFLPNVLSLDEWYAGVYALPTVWPDVSMLGASNLRRVVGYDFRHLRKKYDVPSMRGNIHPQWRLLQQHLETKGLVGTRSLREKSGSLPTGLIRLEMIWKTNFVLTEILLRGVFGVLHRTSYGSYASQLHP